MQTLSSNNLHVFTFVHICISPFMHKQLFLYSYMSLYECQRFCFYEAMLILIFITAQIYIYRSKNEWIIDDCLRLTIFYIWKSETVYFYVCISTFTIPYLWCTIRKKIEVIGEGING